MQNYKILIVDDQHWIKIMLQEVLSNSGFTALTASNHLEAVEIVKNEQPDIVILDVNLPGIDGLSLLSRLKKVKSNIRAVFISGTSDTEYVRRAMAEGALGYFLKPFDILEFTTFLVKTSTSDMASRGEGKWEMEGGAVQKKLVKSIKDYCNYFTENTYTIEQDPPLYIKEGSHRVLIEYQDKKEDNHIHEYDVDFSVIEDPKGLLGCFVTYKNVTELKELRKQKAQYESLLAEKEIAASYVHEIKNPLFSIRGFLQILQQSFSEDDKRKEYADIIITELDRMNNLLNEFLSQYREHSLGEDNSENGISINKIIAEITAFFQYSLELKGITCELDLGKEELFVSIDRDRLMQIFINLIQNSVEAMKKGANLSIKTYGKNKMACIEIKDEGVGIKQEEMNKIFNPFYSTKEKGTGLGLYITKQIITNNGGNIYLESTEGKGTTFYLEFPMKG